MTLFRCLLVLAALLLSGEVAHAQTLSLSFDDPFDPANPGQAEVGTKLRSALKASGLHSTLFVAGEKIDSESGRAELLAWQADGHEIGNHTYSHPNLASGRVSLQDFIRDAERNEAFLASIGSVPQRFRFPFLKEGNTEEKRDGFRAWLTDHRYQSGAVSIDASDWYYDQRYARWRELHPDADDSGFKKIYLEHLWARATYYDGLSVKYQNRSAHHVLLLHANRINARFLPDVIQMFKDHGWTLIDTRDAYADPLYNESPDILPAGESLLWQMAKAAGDTTLRFPGEDGEYESALLDAAGF